MSGGVRGRGVSHPLLLDFLLNTMLSFNNWDDVFFDPIIANAIFDRVLHHAHVVNITGKSYRLKEYIKQEDE